MVNDVPAAEPATHDINLPDLIEVLRYPTGRIRVLIDGEVMPWAISGAADEPITSSVRKGYAPSVRMTLMAHRVEVRDALLQDAELVGLTDD